MTDVVAAGRQMKTYTPAGRADRMVCTSATIASLVEEDFGPLGDLLDGEALPDTDFAAAGARAAPVLWWPTEAGKALLGPARGFGSVEEAAAALGVDAIGAHSREACARAHAAGLRWTLCAEDVAPV